MSIGRIDTGSSVVTMMSTEHDIAMDLGGDINAQVAAMLLVNARDARNNAKVERGAQEEIALAEEHQQIEKLHEQADEIRKAGRERGVAMMVGGGLTVAGSVWAGNRRGSGAGSRNDAVRRFQADECQR